MDNRLALIITRNISALCRFIKRIGVNAALWKEKEQSAEIIHQLVRSNFMPGRDAFQKGWNSPRSSIPTDNGEALVARWLTAKLNRASSTGALVSRPAGISAALPGDDRTGGN